MAGNILAGNILAGNILVGNILAGNILAGNIWRGNSSNFSFYYSPSWISNIAFMFPFCGYLKMIVRSALNSSHSFLVPARGRSYKALLYLIYKHFFWNTVMIWNYLLAFGQQGSSEDIAFDLILKGHWLKSKTK